jgi:hypothetical protein
MVEPEGGWTKAKWRALTAEADTRLQAQGAIVEAMRRVSRSFTCLGVIMIILAVVQEVGAALTIIQWFK